MFRTVVVIAVCCAFVFGYQVGDELEEKWFEQYLDHFNARDNRTFMMRYYEVDDFYRPGGPLLLEIGGEVTVDPYTGPSSPTYEVAKRAGGKVVVLEHRYYGSSAPYDNITDNSDYEYLSAEQALEDVAYFIQKYKTLNEMESCKVAVFGCSYAGTLATWMRYKFPHLVDAAWASSAPIRIVLDFYQYYEVAGELYSNISTECIAMIRQGYREAKTLLTTPQGDEIVREALDGWECGNVTEMSGQEIMATIRMVLANQYSKSGYAVESCDFLQSKNASTTPFQQLAAFVREKSEEVCFDDDVDDVIAWSYQTCTQFGFSFTTSSYKQPFKDSYSAIDADSKFCSDTFGDEFDLEALQRSIERTNRVYGGEGLKVSRVITMHGSQDPWSRVGLQRGTKEMPVFVVPGASHCTDMGQVDDIPLMNQAKRQAYSIMINWLQ
ncbi:hypothetical protein FQR65_LT09115 [Abscondita terminalis]|nr:hypothetical protein FQR65_LT09115 [Abscondita terminalis]